MTPALETLLLPFSRGILPQPARAIFLGALPHPAFAEWRNITGWQHFKPGADDWDAAGLKRTDDIPAQRFPMVLVLPGKARDEILHGFSIARQLLEPSGILAAAMPNTSGAERFEKELQRATRHIESFSKNKCRVFHAVNDGHWKEEIFAEWRALGGTQPVADTPFVTEAGVFSHGHIDAGSALLAASLPANLRGKAADLGAGWGFLTHALLRRNPGIRHVDLFEADSRALSCARLNLSSFLDRTEFHWHDVLTGLPGAYDVIIMNPPFHTGKTTDIGLGKMFIAAAQAALKRNGKLLLVANRQLPYENLLDHLGFRWSKPVENATFKLLFAVKT